MVWPVVAVAAAGAIAQWMNSEQARKASKAERKKMQELLDKIQQPDFDMREITPEDYKVVGKYVPEAAPYIAEANPSLIEETGDMKTARSAQLDALRGLRQAALAEKDPALMAELDLASRRGQAEAQSRQASLLQDAARRGQSSSLNALMAQLKGGAMAQAGAADRAQQAAIEAYRNKLSALRDSASLGGQMRAQDIGMQGSNVNAINAFNQRTAAAQRDYLGNVYGTRNEAQLKNLAMEQDIANKNVSGRNEAAIQNLNRLNNLKQQAYSNEMSRYGQQTQNMKFGMDQEAGFARDRGQAIQGVTDAGISYYNQPKKKKEDEEEV